MTTLNWERVYNYYYKRRNNKVPVEYYEGKFQDIKRFFGEQPITYDTVDSFIDWLENKFYSEHKRKISNSYYNKYLGLLKVVARLHGYNIDDYIQRNEIEDAIPTEKLTLEECERVLTTKIPYKLDCEYKNFRDTLLLKIALITTQRPSNIVSIMWKDYRNDYVYFPMTKNGRSHKVYIPPKLNIDIKKLRVYSHGFMFGDSRGHMDKETVNDIIRKRCLIAGIEKHITFKSLRGTGATQYLKKNALHQVMKITGHRDPKVLANHYYDPENEEIERIIDNNPFDPQPLTGSEKLRMANEFVMSLNKRNCQAVLIPQNENYMIVIPK